ncbi:MAG: hypothetical protein HDR77_02310 [Bacteroides sp.]|nr:hypothetical protein [Bacteroides sp.]
MTRLLHLLLIGVFATLYASAAEPAQKILADAASRLENAPSVSANCVVSANGQKNVAKLIMSGQRFVVESDRMSVWFDGKTQWTWSADTREVTVTEPTPQELAQINPLAILAAFRSGYTATPLPRQNGASERLRLTAKSASADIRQVDITLQAATLAPERFAVAYSGGTTATIEISSFSIGKKLPLTTFRYDPKSHPDAEIVDLR